jgi:hypothetical protein
MFSVKGLTIHEIHMPATFLNQYAGSKGINVSWSYAAGIGFTFKK